MYGSRKKFIALEQITEIPLRHDRANFGKWYPTLPNLEIPLRPENKTQRTLKFINLHLLLQKSTKFDLTICAKYSTISK